MNTPAIITDVVSSRLSGLLLAERFLNNAVSLFVTLGLFGTFLGLSMSVTSLTELIGVSNSSEWLSVMDTVGGGLLSALFGRKPTQTAAPAESDNMINGTALLQALLSNR